MNENWVTALLLLVAFLFIIYCGWRLGLWLYTPEVRFP